MRYKNIRERKQRYLYSCLEREREWVYNFLRYSLATSNGRSIFPISRRYRGSKRPADRNPVKNGAGIREEYGSTVSPLLRLPARLLFPRRARKTTVDYRVFSSSSLPPLPRVQHRAPVSMADKIAQCPASANTTVVARNPRDPPSRPVNSWRMSTPPTCRWHF